MEAPKKTRGFASMSPVRRRDIAALGGASVANGTRAFSRDKELAEIAGRKGGETVRASKSPGDRDRD